VQIVKPAARGSDVNPMDDADLEGKLRTAAAGAGLSFIRTTPTEVKTP
jgi:hypothetical protein